jgi:hypothetical protein
MSDQNLKKVIVFPSELPGFSSIDGGHTVRYRIITEDKNQFSEWSSFYFFPIEENLLNTGEANASIFINSPSYITSFGQNKILNIYWNDLSSFGIRQYDIFVKINNNDFKYQTTTGNNYANIGLGPFVGTIDVRVSVQSPQAIYLQDLVLFKTTAAISVA